MVLSDLHLGESGSVFTSVNGHEPGLTLAFREALADLVNAFPVSQDSALILNGDMLGLAFSTFQESLTSFEHFIMGLFGGDRFCNKLICIPGNHDHHLWQMAWEEDLEKRLLNRTENAPVPSSTYITSPRLGEGFSSRFLDAFFSRILPEQLEVELFYPNFLIQPTQAGGHFILFHHGHFAESIYGFITHAIRALYPDLDMPNSLEALEEENFAWIDFAFSALGRSGDAGGKFETLMTTLSSKKLLQKEKGRLAINLSNSINFPYIPFNWAEQILAKTLIEKIAESVRTERSNIKSVCSEKSFKGLMHYLDTYCSGALKKYGWTGEAITFLWGHTHKPFQKSIRTDWAPRIDVVNTGGWVLDNEVNPYQGASLVLIDETNDVHTLRIYNDAENGGQMHFRIETRPNELPGEFAQAMEAYLYDVDGNLNAKWAAFRDLLSEEIKRRRMRQGATS